MSTFSLKKLLFMTRLELIEFNLFNFVELGSNFLRRGLHALHVIVRLADMRGEFAHTILESPEIFTQLV